MDHSRSTLRSIPESPENEDSYLQDRAESPSSTLESCIILIICHQRDPYYNDF